MHIKLILITIFLVILGIFALNLIAKIFVQEIAQEVVVEETETPLSHPDINKIAPQFELLDLSGGKVKLSDFLESPLILVFWTTWNLISADQIKILDDYLIKNDEDLFKIITINNQEDRSTVSSFIERGGYKIRVLLDQNGQVGESYNIKTLPITYFLDKDGIIKDIFIGALSEKMLVDKIEKILK